jgi:hypothetical protein
VGRVYFIHFLKYSGGKDFVLNSLSIDLFYPNLAKNAHSNKKCDGGGASCDAQHGG